MASTNASVVTEDALVWYLTDARHWWPSLLEQVDSAKIDPENLSEQDAAELFICMVDKSPLYSVKLLGRSSETLQLICPKSKEARIRQPFLTWFQKCQVFDEVQQQELFGAELAAEYAKGCEMMRDLVMVSKSRSRTSEQAAIAAILTNGNEPRRVSVAPETTMKAQQQQPPSLATAIGNQKDGYAKENASPINSGDDIIPTSNNNDDDSSVPTMNLEIKSHDDWESVWDKLDWAGWENVNGVYAKPGVKYFHGDSSLVDGVDYFTTLEGVQEYVRSAFGWTGPRQARLPTKKPFARAQPIERQLFSTPPDQSTVPQDPGKPLFSSSVKVPRKSATKSTKKKNSSVKTRRVKDSVAEAKYQRAPSRMTKEHNSKTATVRKVSSGSKKKNVSLPQWWIKTPLPSTKRVWKLLKKLGYTCTKTVDGDCYELPEGVYGEPREAPVFASLSGLRKFLCKFGIPKYTKKSIGIDEATYLQRWVTFANVPVTKRDSIRQLKKVVLPSTTNQLSLLLADNGFSTMGGKVWAPNVKHGKHNDEFVFDIGTEQDKLKAFIRGAWTLDSMALSMDIVDDDEPLDIDLLPIGKYAHRTSDAKHLALRFWAVASDDIMLPRFEATEANCKAKQIRFLEMLDDNGAEDETKSVSSDETSVSTENASSQSEATHSSESAAEGTDDEGFGLQSEASDDSLDNGRVVSRPVAPPKQATKRKGKSESVDMPWWKHCALPSSDQAWEILERLGYLHLGGIYKLPLKVDKNQLLAFQSLTGLRKFLCKFGIPTFDRKLISEADATSLTRWVEFANVPVDSRNSLSVLSNVSKPRTQDYLRNLLTRNGFTTVDGKFWAPGYKTAINKKEFIFHESELSEGSDGRSRLKSFIRGAWTLDSNTIYTESTPEKHLNVLLDDSHLKLRVWAAATSESLPTFKYMPDRTTEVKMMEMLPDVSFTDDAAASETEFTDDEQSTKAAKRDESCAKLPLVADLRASPANVKSTRKAKETSTVHEPRLTTKKPKTLPWYYHEDTVYMREDWKTLTDIGWNYAPSGYYHRPEYPGQRFDLMQLRQHLCAHGILDIKKHRRKIGQKAFDRLIKWIRFVHVPILPNYFKQKIQTLQPLTDLDALDALTSQFNFQVKGDWVFLPGCASKDDPVHGANFVYKNEVASWLRAQEVWTYNGVPSSRRNSRQKLDAETEKLQLRLRLWAAAKDDPLPQCQGASESDLVDTAAEDANEEDESGDDLNGQDDDASMEETNDLDDKSSEYSEEPQNPSFCNPFEKDRPKCHQNVRKNSFGSRQDINKDPAVDTLARLFTQPEIEVPSDESSDDDEDLFNDMSHKQQDQDEDDGSIDSSFHRQNDSTDEPILLTQA
ncbi:hypothetical protein MPSEU_000416900 [Mayamaea pseudoterrestris]|nr:hypothetical protein MPSEU_000416900 [Mayamaea pseudoterrestris]